LGSSVNFKIKTITPIECIQIYGLVRKINNDEFVRTPIENKEKDFEKTLISNKLEIKLTAYRHLMEFRKYMAAIN
jgi:hypothetical protein